MNSSSVCMLFQNEHAHSAHQIFGDAVKSEYKHFETGRPPQKGTNQNLDSIRQRVITGITLSEKYDIVIAEGSAPLQTLLSYKLVHPQTTALYLAADETFYTLDTRPTRYVWNAIRPMATHLLDGVIAVSQDAYEWACPYIGNHPYRVVHPPISKEKYDQLITLSPSSLSNPFRILTVGEARESKQLADLVEAVSRIRSELNQETELVILGRGHSDQWYAAQEYIRTPGFVSIKEFGEWFECATIYVQPSQGDSYPVASLEAMLAATPTIVTESCGTRHRIPEDQVAVSEPDGLADRIRHMITLFRSERENRGRKHRESVKDLTETSQQEEFRAAATELVTNG